MPGPGRAATPRTLNPKDAASGAVLIALGLFFAYQGRGLTVGTAGQMGPGYFPLVLSGLLVLLGLVVIAGRLGRMRGGMGPVPWRGVGLLAAAVLFFGASVRPLGLGPSLAAAVFPATLASRRWRLIPSLLLTTAMVAFAWAVFIHGLGVPVPLLGPWLR